jgi:hypothetical protein
MTKIYKLLIIIVSLCVFTGITSTTINAQPPVPESSLEGGTYPTYDDPNAPAAPTSINVYLPRFISYIYYSAMALGGTITLLVIIMGGMRFLTSAGNPSTTTDARNQILSGFLGLIIILGSYIILNELNSDLTDLQLPDISPVRNGGILYNKNYAEIQGMSGVSTDDLDLPEVIDLPEELIYKAISSSGSANLNKDAASQAAIYPRSFYSFEDSKTLKLELYQKPDCKGDPVTQTPLVKDALNQLDIIPQCIKMVWTVPGVWIFNKLDTRGGDPGVAPDPEDLPLRWSRGKDYLILQTGQSGLPHGFNNNIAAIAIVPKKPNPNVLEDVELNFAAILHNTSGSTNQEKGWANIYYEDMQECNRSTKNSDEILCRVGWRETSKHDSTKKLFPKATKASSITIFTIPDHANMGEIQICREDICDDHQVGSNFYSADYIINPDKNFYLKNLEGVDWDEYNKPIKMGRNAPDGVTAIYLNSIEPQIVLLYNKFYDDDISKINDNSTDVAIINQSFPSLRILSMNGKTGTIVAIGVRSEF